jgi:hypothetical protein
VADALEKLGTDPSFEYLSRPILNTPKSLRGTRLNRAPPGLLHFIPLVARTEQIIEEVDQMTSEDGRTWKDTLLVWEPDIVSRRVFQRRLISTTKACCK